MVLKKEKIMQGRKLKYPWDKLKRKGSTVEIPAHNHRERVKIRNAAYYYAAYNDFDVEVTNKGDHLEVRRI